MAASSSCIAKVTTYSTFSTYTVMKSVLGRVYDVAFKAAMLLLFYFITGHATAPNKNSILGVASQFPGNARSTTEYLSSR